MPRDSKFGLGFRLKLGLQDLLTRVSIPRAAHLITALTDQGRVPDPTAQSVLTSLAILTEAENDLHQGIRGTWSYDEVKLQRMANRGIAKLEFRGYL